MLCVHLWLGLERASVAATTSWQYADCCPLQTPLGVPGGSLLGFNNSSGLT